MHMFRRFRPSLASAFWMAAMAALWLFFVPVRVGGMASYIIVIGNSMEPGFHIGDLIVTHEESTYRVGDAVVYRNGELENFVFHRIIAEGEGRFTLKGDNNTWTDTYQPTGDEIIGKLWLRIPKGGKVIQAIRQPAVMALIAGALGGFLALGWFPARAKSRKQMNNHRLAAIKQKVQNVFRPASSNSSSSSQGVLFETGFFVLGLVAFSSLILGIVAFSRPAARIVSNEIGYDQLGFFAYSAQAPQGVYDANTLKNGDPIFPNLTCTVDVTFQYTLVAMQAENIAGAYQLTASISEPTSGWQRTIVLQDKTPFSGNAFGVNAKLDLCKVEKLIQDMEQSTDFRSGSYLLTISPNIEVNGQLAGRSFDTTFNPALTFRYDHVHFYLLKEDATNENVLNVSIHGALSGERVEANSLRILGRDFAVPALRWIAMLGLVISLGGLAYLAWSIQTLAQRDPAQLARIRYGAQMVDVSNTALPLSNPVVEIGSLDDLGKLAERFQTVIWHTDRGGTHTYDVQGGGTLYRLVISASKTESAVPEGEAEEKS
ncbi:MAG: signal peptidase I [Chloroflexota bacterium]